MKKILSTAAFLMFSSGLALAAPGHSDDHDGMAHDEMAVGAPGDASKVTQTINVTMMETDEGTMVFKPDSIKVKEGQTVRFNVVNKGELEHEFVLGTKESNAEHGGMMMESSEMEHEDSNSITLEPGKKGSLVWAFAKAGMFEFACLIPGHYESGMYGSIEVAAK